MKKKKSAASGRESPGKNTAASGRDRRSVEGRVYAVAELLQVGLDIFHQPRSVINYEDFLHSLLQLRALQYSFQDSLSHLSLPFNFRI